MLRLALIAILVLALAGGGPLGAIYEIDIAGTPCEAVIEHARLVHFPDNLLALYPDDPDIAQSGAVSYMGVPLLDLDGKILGHMAVVDRRPMPEEPQALALFRIFAARAASASTSGCTSASWNTTSARSRTRAARNVSRSGAPGPAPTR